MLKLTKKADYGLIALKHLAMSGQQGGTASAKEIADAYAILEAIDAINARIILTTRRTAAAINRKNARCASRCAKFMKPSSTCSTGSPFPIWRATAVCAARRAAARRHSWRSGWKLYTCYEGSL